MYVDIYIFLRFFSHFPLLALLVQIDGSARSEVCIEAAELTAEYVSSAAGHVGGREVVALATKSTIR